MREIPIAIVVFLWFSLFFWPQTLGSIAHKVYNEFMIGWEREATSAPRNP